LLANQKFDRKILDKISHYQLMSTSFLYGITFYFEHNISDFGFFSKCF